MSLCRRWQRKRDARPGEILDAALKVFVEKGFRAAKMEDIASVAGVTKGTPYLYYQNKEAIFKAVVQGQLLSCVGKMGELTRIYAGSYTELLYELTDAWWRDVGETEASYILCVLISEAKNFPELINYFYDILIKPIHDLVAEILQKGIEDGEFRPLITEVAADVLVGPILMAMLWKTSFSSIPDVERRMNDPQRHLRNVLDVVINGLSAAHAY